MTEAILSLLLGLVVILAIIAANGFFVAQEFAYMSVDRSRLSALAEGGDAPARRALAITRRTSFMLSGAQLGITVTGLLVGYVAEPLVGESLGVLLGGAGVPAAVSVGVGTTLALVLATVVQMIFGELFPKNLAIAAPMPLARALATPTRIYLVLFGWLVTVFDHSANALLRLLRIEPLEDVDSSANAKDLAHIVHDSHASGDLPEDLSIMIDRIIDFPDRDVRHAMVPRSRVDSVGPDMPLAVLRELMGTAHSRYPVIDEQGDPIGVVQLVDVLRSDAPPEAPVRQVMREIVVLPTSMPLPTALDRLRAERAELACVVDEYGDFDGILTAEDLLEEVAGELTDEHDAPLVVTAAGTGGSVRVAGDAHLDELERALGIELPRGDSETLAGLVIEHLGDLPGVGDRTVIALPDDPGELALGESVPRGLAIEVLETERHVPSALGVAVIEIAPTATAPTEAAPAPTEAATREGEDR